MLWSVRHAVGNLVSGLWIATAIVWVALAFGNKRTVARRGLTGLIPVAAVAVIVLTPTSLRRSGLLHQLWASSAILWVIALLLVASGSAFAIWARLTIGRNWSSTVTLKQDHELVRRGPYSIVRHPIYTGLLSMSVGTMVLTGLVESVGVVAVGIFYVVIKVRDEERLMSETFPAQYPEYRRTVKSIIPFIL
jgi:protein-S-isoprenylcysteine O-methyltransferase Ste14